jgi:hypothetical protein
MIFVPFTGVNHHLQSVFLGATFLANEKIESYVWLFKTFFKAMDRVAPHFIITDEDASMKAAIAQILPDTCNTLGVTVLTTRQAFHEHHTYVF